MLRTGYGRQGVDRVRPGRDPAAPGSGSIPGIAAPIPARPRTPPVPSPCRSGTAARRRSWSDDRRGRAASRPRPAPGRPVRGMDQRLDPVAGPEHEPAAGSGLGPVRPRQDRANPHGRRRPSAASFRALFEAAMLPPIVTSRTVSPGRSQDHFTLQVGLAGGATRHRIDAILSDYAALIRPARDRSRSVKRSCGRSCWLLRYPSAISGMFPATGNRNGRHRAQRSPVRANRLRPASAGPAPRGRRPAPTTDPTRSGPRRRPAS